MVDEIETEVGKYEERLYEITVCNTLSIFFRTTVVGLIMVLIQRPQWL